MSSSCALLVGFGVVGAGLAGAWTTGGIRIHMKEKGLLCLYCETGHSSLISDHFPLEVHSPPSLASSFPALYPNL